MKSKFAFAAALLAMWPVGAAMGKPVTWHGSIWKVILNSGDKKLSLVFGLNMLDKATSFDCGSNAGCIVSTSSTVQVSGGNGGVYLCSYVDSNEAKPACGKVWDSGDVIHLRQYATVGQGAHSVQTAIYSDYLSNGPVVRTWETEYSIYTLK